MIVISRTIVALGAALMLLASALHAAGVLPAPSGPFRVGRSILHWTDASRAESLSPKPGRRREIAVWLWYPAVPAADAVAAPYIDRIDTWKSALSRSELSMVRDVRTHSVTDAPPAPGANGFPVVLFSSGSGSVPALYTGILEGLASNGYVVAAIGHPYEDKAVVLADGSVVKPAKEPRDDEERLRFLRERAAVRAEDMGFALDQLARMQSGDIPGALRGRLDLGRVVAFGHSTGGLAAADFCMRDARARACANLDGMASAQPAYPDASGRGPKQPFMFMDKPLQRLRNEKPGEAYTRLTRLRERGNAVLAGVESGRSYRVTIRDATHASFSDEEILASSGSGRPLAILETVRACLLAFFNEALNGQEAPLLAPTTVENEIRIEMFGKR